VNKREREVARRYEADGWVVLRNGAPDFLVLRVADKDGVKSIAEVEAVEVKAPGDRLTFEQALYRQALEKLGVRYHLETVE
jgi:hypothetical protein